MKKLGLQRFTPIAWVVLAAIAASLTRRYAHGHVTPWGELIYFLHRVVFKVFGGFPAAQSYAVDVVKLGSWIVSETFGALALWTMFLVPLGFVARLTARARLRAGTADPLDRFRAWTRNHRVGTQLALAFVPFLWGAGAMRALYFGIDGDVSLNGALLRLIPVALASSLVHYAGTRSLLGSLLAPTIDPTEEARIEIGPDEITFDAVAVTREAQAAVGALAGLSLGMTVWIAALPIATLFRDPRLFAAVAAYIVIAIATATTFRFASRVAVGLDGVLVKGTSKTRFYAYRDLDDVAVANGDIELRRRGKVLLRLQMHGADAVRREAVTDRIRTNIARVKAGESAVAAQLVASSSKEALSRVASGRTDYRAATLSREALWALIEGPTVDAESRRAAAEALATTNDDHERARLRIAAEHCADPRIRVALTELAERIPEDASPARRHASARP